jgi:hypothetical protein
MLSNEATNTNFIVFSLSVTSMQAITPLVWFPKLVIIFSALFLQHNSRETLIVNLGLFIEILKI